MHPVPLDPGARSEIAAFLGLASLPDECAKKISHGLGTHVALAPHWPGLTPGRNANALRRLAEALNRAMRELRVITEPEHLMEDETTDLLIGDAEPLATMMKGFRERVLARASELDAMGGIRPEHEALACTVAFLKQHCFDIWAAPHVRENEGNMRGFALKCLDAAGIDTGNLKEHPDRLREMMFGVLLVPPAGPA